MGIAVKLNNQDQCGSTGLPRIALVFFTYRNTRFPVGYFEGIGEKQENQKPESLLPASLKEINLGCVPLLGAFKVLTHKDILPNQSTSEKKNYRFLLA